MVAGSSPAGRTFFPDDGLGAERYAAAMNVVLSSVEMIELERQALADGVDAWDLMVNAGREMAEAIRRIFPDPGYCVAFVGKGNNGGDALVAAHYLQNEAWDIDVRMLFPLGEMSPLARRAFALYRPQATSVINWHPLIVLDGLLGVGASGPLRSPVLEAVEEIATMRQQHGAVVFALDLPTGIEADAASAVTADHTLTVAFAKEALLRDEATDQVGRISVIRLKGLVGRWTSAGVGRARVATAEVIGGWQQPRSFDWHKGKSGRVGIVAGAPGMTGAAVLAATGALRTGAGLVTVFTPPECHALVAMQMPPEVMTRPWVSVEEVLDGKFDVLAIGPGLALEWRGRVRELVQAAKAALVLDAGALAIFTPGTKWPELEGHRVLLTPHPGEMERMFPREGRSREQWARAFVEEKGMTLLLKGARTLVVHRELPVVFNTTGHPGMATGGMGDVLTGVCAALMGQGVLRGYEAGCLGAWVCGRAAEIAVWEDRFSQESLLPSDVVARLGRAFADARRGVG